MFYEPGISSHGLPFDRFKSCVVPRPIGWISTTSPQGIDNLAPFSQFQNITFDPPVIMLSANQSAAGNRKDTVINAETTGEFVWNMATWELRHEVNATSAKNGLRMWMNSSAPVSRKRRQSWCGHPA